MRRYIVDKPLKWKVQAINICTAALLVLLSCMIAYSTLIVSSKELLQASVGNSLTYSADTLGSQLVAAETLSNLLYSDSVIQTQLAAVAHSPTGIISLSAKSSISGVLQRYVEQYQSLKINYISLTADSFSYATNETLFGKEDSALLAELRRQADDADGALVVCTSACEQTGLYLTRAVRKIDDFSFQRLGYITVCIDMEALVSAATRFSSTFGETEFALFDRDTALFRSDALGSVQLQGLEALTRKGYGIIHVDGQPFFGVGGSLSAHISWSRLPLDWSYYCLVPYAHIQSEMTRSYLLFAAFSILLILFSCFLSGRCFAPIIQKLDHLVTRMRRFDGTASPEHEPAYQLRQDEIGLLHRQFESMGDKICLLIKENYEMELLAKAAELQSLVMQVNPHFLYNVLESINWQAQSAGLTTVCQMVDSLGKLMRGTVGITRQTVALEEELAFVAHYVKIQKLRFEDVLNYQTDIDESMYGIMVPRLSIQPLVDNAIRYGMQGRFDEACSVYLSIQRGGGSELHICVMNTGSAFEPDLLNRLRTGSIQPHGTGIGLVNIDKRLRILYGDDYGLTLLNEGELAKAMIRIPITEKTKGEALHAAHDYCGR